jgi:Squalene-hopene cyclase C-terminal domain
MMVIRETARMTERRSAIFGAFALGVCLFLPSVGLGQVAAPAETPKLKRGGEEITPEAKNAIDRGLAYLARQQERRGSWSNTAGQGRYPVAMTSLAGLALLMDGNTTTQGRYAPQVDRCVKFLLGSVQPSGLITGGEEESRPMYGHGFAMLFLSQLYGMTEDVDRARQIHRVLRNGVGLIQRAQSPEGGWIYRPDSRGDEGSVTITQVQAIRSCRNAGIAVPKDVIDDAMAYLAASQNSDGGIRYSLRQTRGGSRAPITAAAVACWFNAGEYDNPLAKKAVAYCKQNISPGGGGGHDFYANLYWAQALYISSDPYWDEYFPVRRDFLLGVQRSDGSWNQGAGDIYHTSVALVVLQLPLHQLPIMQR